MSGIQPLVTTQYPGGEPMLLTAPLNEPVSAEAIVANSSAVSALTTQIAGLQSQITALAARVTALENAASASAPAA